MGYSMLSHFLFTLYISTCAVGVVIVDTPTFEGAVGWSPVGCCQFHFLCKKNQWGPQIGLLGAGLKDIQR